MESSGISQSHTDNLISPSKKTKIESEDGDVRRRVKADGKDLSKNRLSQRASILCMCQCENGDCIVTTTTTSQVPHANDVKCELHKTISYSNEANMYPSQPITASATQMEVNNVEPDKTSQSKSSVELNGNDTISTEHCPITTEPVEPDEPIPTEGNDVVNADSNTSNTSNCVESKVEEKDNQLTFNDNEADRMESSYNSIVMNKDGANDKSKEVTSNNSEHSVKDLGDNEVNVLSNNIETVSISEDKQTNNVSDVSNGMYVNESKCFDFCGTPDNIEDNGRDITLNECFDDCAPDVYGSECLASVSSSCSLNNINVTLSDDCEKTVEDNADEHVDSGYIGNDFDHQGTSVDAFDKTLKCMTEDSDGNESEDSEIELETGEISVDDIDIDGDTEEIQNKPTIQNVQCRETLTEVVPVRLKSAVGSSGPLCASTPIVSKQHRDIYLVGKDKGACPTFTTFKPQPDSNDIRPVEGNMPRTNSQPLCASTPVGNKPVSELRRDNNVLEQGRDKCGRRNIIDDILCLDSCVEDKMLISNIEPADETEIRNVEIKGDAIGETAGIDEKGRAKVKRSESRKDKKEGKDKKKVKGTRIEKFKEYMGPGLTSKPDDENEPTNNKPKDYLKNTDVETCTLTEYKGFGLTGPLPDKPLHTSTPAPPKGLSVRDTNIMRSAIDLQRNKPPINPYALPKSVSYKDIMNRPAGTEGFILNPDGTLPTFTRTNSFKGKMNIQKPVQLSSMTSQKPIQLTSLQSQQSLHPGVLLPPSDCLSGSSGQMTSGTSSALQPDDIYPSVSSVRSDKSDNCSTDRSDKSNKSNKPIDAHVLQSPGQLKVSAYMNFGLLTVHVVQGRQLSTKWKSTCDSFVKMCLIPDDGKKPKCKTSIVQDSNNPLFDEKFSFELTDEDHAKRLMVSVWHRDQNASVNEFLGCMSFGIRHLTNPKKEVSGWYYLLTEDIGRKKHLKVTHRQVPQLKVRHHANIPAVNKDVWGTETHYLTLHRGKNGFGFSVVEACPVRVGRVDGTSPAEIAGLHPGDIIIRLNKQNVSRSTATSVAKLVKASSNTLSLEIHRQKPITFEHLENPQNAEYVQYEMNENEYTVPDMNTINEEDKENTMADETIYGIHPNITSLATSTPLPLLARGHRTVQTSEMRKQEAIHRLLSLELDFIDLMHAGMQRYSRPLRHCILSHSQHTALFQNIEKLTTISEYHVKQMHDNAPSSFVSEDTDTSVASENHSFMQSIGLIYQSKVHMLCQAYDLYAKGVSRANQLVTDLQKNEDFMKFIHDPHLDGNQPSIQQFVYQPVKHVRDLYRVIQDIFLNTSQDSSDYNSLKQVVEGLQECATSITNYSCERIESVSSLASRESKTSFTSSMKSRSSTCSSRSSSSKGHSSGPSCSMQTSKSIDAEVMRIQDKLVFSSNVPVFQLCQDDRHIVFSGDMFKWEGHQWVKVHMILFTDMILLTLKEADGYLRVLQEPTMLRDITGMDAQRHHGTELVLYGQPRCHSNRKLSLRAPSTEQKYAWKSLIEQRVFAVRGSLEYYSSTSDVSSSSASAIII